MLCKCLSSGMTWMLLLKISHQLIRVKDMQWLSYLYISEGGFIPNVDISSLRTLTGLGQRSWVVVVTRPNILVLYIIFLSYSSYPCLIYPILVLYFR